MKRIASPAFLVTSHDAQRYPNFTAAAYTKSRSEKSDKEFVPSLGVFDKILADVPCSGDGTVRKSPDIWQKWSNHDGLFLHPLQLQIAKRGADLLKV